MSNPLRGEATFKAGERSLTLAFSINAFCDLEADTGLGVNELVEELQGNPSFTMLRRIICAGLQEKQPGTTLEDAGNIMSDAGIDEITSALHTAMAQAMPEVADGDVNPPNRNARRATAARKK